VHLLMIDSVVVNNVRPIMAIVSTDNGHESLGMELASTYATLTN